MSDDTELLRRYLEARDDAAFAELVRRHIDLVHSAALRQLNGDAHLAADVTQIVFTDLARKARVLVGHRVLVGWLFTSTRFAAAKAVRSEQRRRGREREAHLMQQLTDDKQSRLDWERVRPVLDEALAELKDGERAAILLRYFEGRDFADVGARLSLNANAARMRVERALEKLQALLARRGLTSTTAALALALGSHAVVAAPAGLAITVTSTALAGGAVVAGATFMAITKLQMGLAAAVAIGGTTAFVLQAETNSRLKNELAALRQTDAEMAALRAENTRLARIAAEVEELRRDDMAFARIESEAVGLRQKIATLEAAQAEQERRAAIATKATRPSATDLKALDRLPVPSYQTRPAYPAEFREQGITGEVLLEFVIDSEGFVQEVVPVRSTHAEFEAPAIAAVSQWRFTPGLKGGRAVNTRLQVPIVFSLGSDEGTAGGLRVRDGVAGEKR